MEEPILQSWDFGDRVDESPVSLLSDVVPVTLRGKRGTGRHLQHEKPINEIVLGEIAQ